MRGPWKSWPLLRQLTPLQQGLLEAGFVALLVSSACAFGLGAFEVSPSPDAFSGIAQVGATLLVGYAVEISWWLKTSPRRGETRENWVGFVTGIGCCGLLGVITALTLSAGSSELGATVEQVAVSWTFVSLGMLGLLVALLPHAIYEWTHSLRAEYADE